MNRRTLTLGEVVDWMDEQYPPELREDRGRVGLTCGDCQDPVTKILLAVDPIEAVVDEALEWGAQLATTHHPLPPRGASFVSTDTAKGRVVHRLIRPHAGLFNTHTNADAVAGGIAKALAEAAGLTAATWRPLELNPNHPELRIGQVGDLPEPCILGGLANRLAEVLPDSPIELLVAGDLDREAKTVAASGDSGQPLLKAARESSAEVFATADLRHHPALDYREESGAPALLVPSHWASEWLWLPCLATALELWVGEHNFAVETRISKIVSEPWDAYIPTLTPGNFDL